MGINGRNIFLSGRHAKGFSFETCEQSELFSDWDLDLSRGHSKTRGIKSGHLFRPSQYNRIITTYKFAIFRHRRHHGPLTQGQQTTIVLYYKMILLIYF